MPIPMKATFIQMQPVAPSIVPENAVFVDSQNSNTLSNKNNTNITITVVQETANILFKQMQAGEDLSTHWPLAKLNNGKVVRFDANDPDRKNFCGYAMADVLNNAGVSVFLVGANLAGAINGLGFTPGDEVYIDNNGSYTNDPSTIAIDQDSDIIKVGIADCAGGATASSTAVDIITFPEIISRS